MLKHAIGITFCVGLLLCAWVSAQVTIINGGDATLEDLVSRKAIVTVIISTTDPDDPDGQLFARDPNLTITGVHRDSITFKTDDGQDSAYPLSWIKEIRVQDGRVSTLNQRVSANSLNQEDRATIGRAAERAMEIFKQTRDNQGIRMLAALVLSVSTHENKVSALGYLQELANGNHVPTAMAATTYLYLAGIPPDQDVLREGFRSGDRKARATAARLVGLTNDQSFVHEVRTMLHDSLIEIFPAAAKATGRMNDRSGLPELYEAIHALREAKAEAAVFALSRIGGDEVLQEMKDLLKSSEGTEWFRVLRVLFALGDPEATTVMKEVCLDQPAYQRTAGLLITASGDWDGRIYLREYLKKPSDPNLENLIYRAMVGATLFQAGDIQAKSVLQRLLNTKPGEIYARGRTSDEAYKQATATTVKVQALRLIGDTGSRDLISLLVGSIQSADPAVAIEACQATLAIGNSEFGDRLREARL